MRSTPSSVSCWTTVSGFAPLVSATATATDGVGVGSTRAGPARAEDQLVARDRAHVVRTPAAAAVGAR